MKIKLVMLLDSSVCNEHQLVLCETPQERKGLKEDPPPAVC